VRDSITHAKAEIYQKVFATIFRKTQVASHEGIVLECSDKVVQRGYPDILIE
jgi:hypothetical protein